MRETEQKIFQIIASQIGSDASQIKRDNFISQDLGMDSLDAVEVTMEIEDTFDISIPDDEADACKTVGDVVKLVEKYLQTDNG